MLSLFTTLQLPNSIILPSDINLSFITSIPGNPVRVHLMFSSHPISLSNQIPSFLALLFELAELLQTWAIAIVARNIHLVSNR